MNNFLEDEQFLSELKQMLPDNPVMFAGWVGCVDWASRHDKIPTLYTRDTGRVLDRDYRASMLAFTDWVTQYVWGDENVEDDDN